MKTTDGKKMTQKAATEPIGTALRIAPGFTVTAIDEATGIESTLEAVYHPEQGRYVVKTIVSRAIRDDFDETALKYTATAAILQAAIPHCIAVHLEHGWITIAELSLTDERLIPEWLAASVAKRGTKTERMEVIQMIYGAAALAGLPPTKAVQLELGIPHRTASDWIGKARTAGYLKGMSYTPGRQADD